MENEKLRGNNEEGNGKYPNLEFNERIQLKSFKEILQTAKLAINKLIIEVRHGLHQKLNNLPPW